MSDLIIFDCPYCGQNLDSPPEFAGRDGVCPACRKSVMIPGAYQSPLDTKLAEQDSNQNSAPLEDLGEGKSETIAIDLGDEMVLPKAKPRVFRIRRPGGS